VVVSESILGMSKAEKHPVWNKVFFVLELACIPLALWWIPYSHLPEPGWAVALIAGAAAAMSVHDDMKGWQKLIWLLVIGAFLITELRAIHKDRVDNDAKALEDRRAQDLAFKGVRDSQDADFKATAGGLEAAIGGIKSTLTTANTTLQQTQPHAAVMATTFEITNGPTPPALFDADTAYHFNFSQLNNGSDQAIIIKRVGRIYVAKPDDLAAQQEIVAKFAKDWRDSDENNKKGKPVVSQVGVSGFWTEFLKVSADDVNNLKYQRNTLYIVRRIEYKDKTGTWWSDRCESYQVEDKDHSYQLELNITHSCFVLMTGRYRARLP
jgi:hypothetical protein